MLYLLVSVFMLETSFGGVGGFYFVIYLVPHFSHFCAFCWKLCYFKWPPRVYGPKCKKAVIHRLKKIGVLGKFHPGMSCGTVGHQRQSTVDIK